MFRRQICLGIALSFTVALTILSAEEPQKPAKVLRGEFAADRNDAQAIAGLASSARHCIGPSGANVHTLGWVPSSTDVVVTFSSDFDPVAVMTVVQIGEEAPDGLARASFLGNDDGGGNLEPEIRFRTTFSGTLNLHVSKFSANRTAGCYFYKVEIRTP